jgi:hypothetical protein
MNVCKNYKITMIQGRSQEFLMGRVLGPKSVQKGAWRRAWLRHAMLFSSHGGGGPHNQPKVPKKVPKDLIQPLKNPIGYASETC